MHEQKRDKKAIKVEKQSHNKLLAEDQTEKKVESMMKKIRQAEKNVEHIKVCSLLMSLVTLRQ